jgi:CBS domain-containing protein
MLIGEICTRDVVQCDRNTSALELAQLMRKSHVGDVVVTDQPNGKRVAIGIVTDRDLAVKVLAEERDPLATTAADIMEAELITAGERNSVYEVAELMRFRGVRRIPLVDEDGALTGIVTLDDLLGAIGEELNLLAKALSRERAQEERGRS